MRHATTRHNRQDTVLRTVRAGISSTGGEAMHGQNTRRPTVHPLSEKAGAAHAYCCRHTRGGQVLLRTRIAPDPDVDHELYLNRFGTTLGSARHHRP